MAEKYFQEMCTDLQYYLFEGMVFQNCSFLGFSHFELF